MARLPSASEVSKAWIDAAAAAGAAFVAGVERVTENPCAKAADRASIWQANVSAPRALERFQRGLRKQTLESWKTNVRAKGASAFTNGIRAAQGKYEASMGKVLTFMSGVLDRVRTMPSATLEDNISRAVEFMRGMAGFTGE